MAKSKRKSKSSKKGSQKTRTKIELSGHTFVNKSGHLLTSRPYGSGSRMGILLILVFLLLMTLMSVYAIVSSPFNPAVWATLVFFSGLLTIAIMNEDNIFPKIPSKKRVWAIATWFIAFLITPYIVVMMETFNFTFFIVILIFLVFLVPVVVKLILPPEESLSRKISDKVKEKVNDVKKTSQKKKKTRKSNELKGVNRKRKIYRR
jgi:hypothetical protein